MSEPTSRPRPARIDVHQHMVPSDYAAWLRGNGVHAPGGRALPDWTPDLALEFMDRHGIATGVLSLTTPGVHLGDDAAARTMAHRANDFGAALMAEHPERFGLWASLPLPDVRAATGEAVRALDDLSADGVVLLANHRGLYLGDPALDPLMDVLDERRAVVFVHPADLPGPPAEGIPPFAADFLLDTTRAAFNLVKHDVPRRYPGIRFILSHAGGFVPYAAHRLAAVVFAETGRDPAAVLDDLAGFYFDTALSSSPSALPSLHAFAKPGHVLYGSDWPFAPDLAVSYFSDFIADDDAISHTNAHPLFPRLAPQ
ncbi:amidohydrolase family protein [Actinomadura bangladeshensis]|uniref:Amidohydrolase family protein n=1 Tax=Actinomadura bangladeshensis TaxID=453573 RepID=A0A6L9Q9H5_9ACTN|nr:amidohydrolase family protein [Actinomadura bangladeshensis]NEA21712.1 amidohydrolase family protein [Actinomadura bangladeshensis]